MLLRMMQPSSLPNPFAAVDHEWDTSPLCSFQSSAAGHVWNPPKQIKPPKRRGMLRKISAARAHIEPVHGAVPSAINLGETIEDDDYEMICSDSVADDESADFILV
jgi:hypothetical protein